MTGDGITYAVVYHVLADKNGAGFADFKNLYIASVLIFVFYSLFFIYMLRVRKKTTTYANTKLLYLAVLISIGINPAIHDVLTFSDLYKKATFAKKTQAYEIKHNYSSDFNAHYITPHISQTHTNSKLKNIVLIYLESLEYSFSDKKIFPGLTPQLNALEQKGISFDNITQIKNTQFTISGMVLSQCGVPLFSPTHVNALSGVDRFLNGIDCVSDLLKTQDYTLEYYGGADLNFAGKGTFYKTHLYDAVNGKQVLLPLLENPRENTWGLYDEDLFDIVYERFLKLSKQEEHFLLTMLTLDTHPPEGNPSEKCLKNPYGDGTDPYLNAVHCTDLLIGEFMDKISSSSYADDTLVIIVSDHIAQKNTAQKLLEKIPERKNRFLIISPELEPQKISRIGSLLDVMPTALSFAGFNTRLGLGRNLMDTTQTTDEILFIQSATDLWRKDIASLWDFPTISGGLKIIPDTRQIEIDDRIFQFPVRIDIDEKLNTELAFRFTLEEYGLMWTIQDPQTDINFILIEECRVINNFYTAIHRPQPLEIPLQTTYCLASGKDHTITYIEPLNNTIIKSSEDIKKLLTI